MTSTRDLALAIDLGTSGPKVALVTDEGDVVGHAFEPTELLLLGEGAAEQRPGDWWQAIVAATGRVLEDTGTDPAAVVAVCATTQWSGTVAVDRRGEPLMNAVSWMDSRGASDIRRLVDGWIKLEGYALSKALRWIWITGGAPGLSGKDPIAHILWMQRERPEVYAAAHTFLEPKDYINLKLTGKTAAGFDSIALHWVTDNRDISAVDYHPGLLRMTGLERDKLPDLRRATDVLGELTRSAADELGLPAGIPVVMGTPDVHAAAIGSGGVRDFDPHVYVGTSSWMVCHVPFKKTDLLHNMASLPSAIPGRYLLLNEQETAGACLNFLRDSVLFPADELTPDGPPEDLYRRFDEIAARAPAGSGGLIFTPWLYGERTPIEDHSVRGGFFNLSLDASRAHLIRSVLEGVALNSRWLLGHVERFMGRPVPSIRMVGGGARSDLWCQIYADVLGRPIRQVAGPLEAGARGAGALAFVGLGRLTFEDVAERVRVARTFEPIPEHTRIHDEQFREFVALYRNNRRAFARINSSREA